MVGNFCGHKFCEKQAQIRVWEICVVLTLMVSESDTHALASYTCKAEQMYTIVYRER